MASYMHGSSALKQERENQVRVKPNRKAVYRAKTIPIKEKLFYLFIISLLVTVAGIVLWRYALIYQLNSEIHKVETQIRELEISNNSLKQQIDKMNDLTRIKLEAEKNGLTSPKPEQIVRVPLTVAPSGNDAGSQTNP
ncbi:Protein required for the initiation of cell division [Chlamydia abortus]|uniref:Cell division protein FtsL n=1 Tax=Paenibacillus residui TaxID=629724 RepID=A0ABW3DC45_9BACL|nr:MULTISPECIES: cell division protein FtsL [Paenibacillaceae]SHE10452.1 Protein required for the initiation of cell division [Chlamydia abortus]